jgi:hypothetical protein
MNTMLIHPQVTALLGLDEPLIWMGQPKQGVVIQWRDIVAIPLSLVRGIIFAVVGWSFFNRVEALYICIAVVLWILVFYDIIGRFFADAYWRSRTYYALTPRRIIIHNCAVGSHTTSHDLRSLVHLRMDVRGNGRGVIQIGKEDRIFGWLWHDGPIPGIGNYTNSLKMISNTPAVYEMIEKSRSDLLRGI